MTTGGVTRRTQRTTTVSGSTVTNAPAGPNGTKSTNITAAASTASKTQGTKLVDVAVKKKTTGLNKTIATTRGINISLMISENYLRINVSIGLTYLCYIVPLKKINILRYDSD